METSKKILYVDDEEINVRLFDLTLCDEFDIITANSGIRALELIDQDPDIQIVVSDLKMPEMDGLEFIKIAKSKKEHLVCMLLTGFVESEVMMEGFNRELIFRYLMKPWKKDQMVQTIQEAFQRFSL